MRTEKRTMGRPPAEWVYTLAARNIENDVWLDQEEVAELLKTTGGAIRSFCAKCSVEGEYRKAKGGAKKYYSLKEMKKAATLYISTYKKP